MGFSLNILLPLVPTWIQTPHLPDEQPKCLGEQWPRKSPNPARLVCFYLSGVLYNSHHSRAYCVQQLENFPEANTTALFPGAVPWCVSLPHGHLCSVWFVLSACEFWISSSMCRIDLIAFNLSSKTYFSKFNQYQCRKLKRLRTVSVVTTLQPRHLLDNKDYYT